MARQNKTTFTDADVSEFVDQIAEEQQRADSLTLIRLMQDCSGHEPQMWGASIIGFGQYHYRYASGHEGDAPLIGFAPRKTAISVYTFCHTEEDKALLSRLGKYKMGKACLYIKKLEHIDTDVLRQLLLHSIAQIKATYPVL